MRNPAGVATPVARPPVTVQVLHEGVAEGLEHAREAARGAVVGFRRGERALEVPSPVRYEPTPLGVACLVLGPPVGRLLFSAGTGFGRSELEGVGNSGFAPQTV